MPVIECTDLTKTYSRRVTALNNLTLNINEGASFGLLGENGAGKSTLVRIIMGFIYPTSGSIRVLGETQVARAHSRIGYVHERPIFETRFTGRSYLTYLAQLSGLWDTANTARVSQLFSRVNLSEAADRPLGTYSKGMLQRLAIAQALLTEPDLLILDEPTSGLDPRSQWEVRQILASLRKEGKTLLICSHYLAEIEALCDTVGILRRGTLLLHGKVDDLLHSQGIVEITLASDLSAADIAARLQISDSIVETQGNLLRIIDSSQQTVLARLLSANIPIVSLNPVSRTLEEVYVSTTQTRTQPEVSNASREVYK
ncbi:MAG: ABC transporter ATP-binding protein [Ktedonobacteraceae bacterium]|nr:ABC transporter ATP-binding protein [Ktedonobacteraceae bacterium]